MWCERELWNEWLGGGALLGEGGVWIKDKLQL